MARIALYRKYRPSKLSEIKGQDHVVKTLSHSLDSHKFSHAYLFCGPRGTGKTSAARIMAKGVNCQRLDKGDPCDKCPSCISINDQRALDIIEVDAASNRGIDEIRDLREKVKFSPSELRYKVFIIDEVHMLTKEAFNALLKTLEEPPEHAIFIMATTEIHRIPATVISRCQRFDFKKISEKDIAEKVREIAKAENIKIDDEATLTIAKAGEGALRDAISIFDQISMSAKEGIVKEKDVLNILGAIDSRKAEEIVKYLEMEERGKALTLVSQCISDGADLGQLTKAIMDVYREKLSLSKDESLERYIYAIETLSECNRNFKYAIHPQLALEVSIIKIARGGSSVKGINKQNTESQESPPKKLTPMKKEKDLEKRKEVEGENIESKWPQILYELKSKNRSIHAFLKESNPVFYDEEIHLFFPFKFHKERIEDARNRHTVEEAIKKICGRKCEIICKLTKADVQKEKKSEKESKDNLLDILGGEVIS